MDDCLVELSELDQAIQAQFQKASRIDSRLSECKAQLQEAHAIFTKAEQDYIRLRERVHRNSALHRVPWTTDDRSVAFTSPPGSDDQSDPYSKA